MQLEYEVTRKDLADAELHRLKKAKSYFVFSFMLTLSIVFSALFILELTSSSIDELPLVVFGLFAVISFAVGVQFDNRVQAKRTVNRSVKSGAIDSQYFGRHTLVLDDLSIKKQYGTIKSEFSYVGISKIEEYPNGIKLFINQTNVDIIPYSAFKNTDERINFLSTLKNRIATALNIGIPQENIDEQAQQAIYTLNYSWSKETFTSGLQNANQLFYKTRLGWTNGQIISSFIGLYIIVAGVNGVIGFFSGNSQSIDGNFSFFPFYFLFVGIMLQIKPLFSLIPPLTRKVISTSIKNGSIPSDYFGTQMLFVKHDRMTEMRRMTTYDIMLNTIYCIRQDSNNLYILLKKRRFVIIPLSAFQTPEQVQEVVQFLENKMQG